MADLVADFASESEIPFSCSLKVSNVQVIYHLFCVPSVDQSAKDEGRDAQREKERK